MISKRKEFPTIFLLSLFLVCALNSFGQEYLDKKIIITVSDSAGLYQKVRIALGKNDFQMKEDGNYSVVSTFARELKKTPGYTIARAEIFGNTVTLTGRYGLLRIDEWGKTNVNSSWKNIVYMKNSKFWPLMMKVAKEIGSDFTYSK